MSWAASDWHPAQGVEDLRIRDSFAGIFGKVLEAGNGMLVDALKANPCGEVRDVSRESFAVCVGSVTFAEGREVKRGSGAVNVLNALISCGDDINRRTRSSGASACVGDDSIKRGCEGLQAK